MEKLMKILLKIFVIILVILIGFIIVNFIFNKYKLKKEYKELYNAWYINKYSAGDYDLNIYRIGNKNSKYKIIGISGLGCDNFSIEMSNVNKELIDKYDIIYIDRAGYGYSDDTSKSQTVEQVVSDYRTALKNAGVEGPYILMPHSYGGVFATYWESEYPDEIDGVILIDTSELGIDIWEKEDYTVGLKDYINLYGTKIGLHRYLLRKYVYLLPKEYSEKEQKYTDYLYSKSIMSKAKISEKKHMNDNTNYVFNNIKENDIPKIYIESSTGFRTRKEFLKYLNWIHKRQKEIGMKVGNTPSDEKIDEFIQKFIDWENNKIKPYINKLGNTKIKYLPGDHMIFEEDPEGLSKVINQFIEELQN